MRTQGALFADTPQTGGWIFMNAVELTSFAATLVLTRNALADYSLNRIAAGAETFTPVTNLSSAIRKLTLATGSNGMPFQEQFGSSTGTAGYPAGAAGLPPFTGASQLTPPTAMTPKGILITDVVAVYQVGVVDLTSASLSLNRTTFANNAAKVITNLPIAATALPLTAAGDPNGPYVVTRAVTTTAFEVTDLSDVTLELNFVMANTGTIRVYGLGFHVNYNFN